MQVIDERQRAKSDAAARGPRRRELIIETAQQVIAEVGPDALTHRRVADRAGIPLAATTYWFASKEDLLLAAFEAAADEDLDRLRRYALGVPRWSAESIAGELAQMVETARVHWRSNTVIGSTLWVETLRRPSLVDVAQRWLDGYDEFLIAAIASTGVSDIAPTDATLLGIVYQGLVVHQLSAPAPLDTDQLTTMFDRLIISILHNHSHLSPPPTRASGSEDNS